jgi:hypothetical protein
MKSVASGAPLSKSIRLFISETSSSFSSMILTSCVSTVVSDRLSLTWCLSLATSSLDNCDSDFDKSS